MALTLFSYYRSKLRLLKIVVVEAQHSNQVNEPWCGVNTFNNKHFHNTEFMEYVVELVFQSNGVIPLGGVKSIEQANSNSSRPNGNVLHASLQERPEDRPVAVFYHPVHLMNKIRTSLLGTDRVLFASLYSTSFDLLVRQLEQSHHEDIVALNFEPLVSQLLHLLPYLVHSNLSVVQYEKNAARGGPHTVLWLPRFRALTSSTYEPTYSISTTSTSNTHRFILAPSFNEIHANTVLNLDIFSALVVGDLALQLTINILSRAKFLSLM